MCQKRPLADKVDPKTTALIVVDMQNDFISPRGAFARRGVDMSMIQGMVPRLLDLVAAARGAQVPLIYLRNIRSCWSDSPVYQELLTEGRPASQTDFSLEGSWGAEFYQGFCPGPGERVITKYRYSGFVGTELDIVLRARGIETLLLTGVSSNICVESTARDGFMRDYRIILVEDCAATTSKSLHEATLENIRRCFGTVVSSPELISLWEALPHHTATDFSDES